MAWLACSRKEVKATAFSRDGILGVRPQLCTSFVAKTGSPPVWFHLWCHYPPVLHKSWPIRHHKHWTCCIDPPYSPPVILPCAPQNGPSSTRRLVGEKIQGWPTTTTKLAKSWQYLARVFTCCIDPTSEMNSTKQQDKAVVSEWFVKCQNLNLWRRRICSRREGRQHAEKFKIVFWKI